MEIIIKTFQVDIFVGVNGTWSEYLDASQGVF